MDSLSTGPTWSDVNRPRMPIRLAAFTHHTLGLVAQVAAKLEHAKLESAARQEGDRLTTGRYAWTLEATMLEVRLVSFLPRTPCCEGLDVYAAFTGASGVYADPPETGRLPQPGFLWRRSIRAWVWCVCVARVAPKPFLSCT
jgi:hypothetical protein